MTPSDASPHEVVPARSALEARGHLTGVPFAAVS
jgi:hypothetical protein